MKFICFTLTAIWLILSGAELAYGEPVTAAIFGTIFAASTAGQFVSLGIALAFNLGVGLIQKAMAKRKAKDQTRGVSFELQVGDDQPMSFTVGKFAAGGRRKYTGIHGEDGRFFVDVIELENIPNPGQPEIWVNDEKVEIDWDHPNASGFGCPVPKFRKDGSDRLWVIYHDGTQTTPDAYLRSKFGSEADRPFTADMIGRGCPYLIVTAKFAPGIFPSVPSILTETPVRPFYDLRKDSTNGGSGTHRWNNQATWEPTQNPIIIIYNIIRGIYYGNEWVYGGQNLAAFRLPASNWIAAANECDVNITLSGGGTEKQFRCGYEVFCDVEPLTVIEELLQTCNGRMAEVGGIFKVMVGAPGAAVFSFTDADVLVTEGQSFNPFPPFSETHNGIEATYPEPAEKWATKDAPARYSSAYMTADLDQELVVGVQFEACPFKTQVQRLMKTMLQEERRFRTHEFYLPPSAWRLEPNDVVSWTSARNGYVNKKFLVVRVIGRRTFNQLVSLKEIDPNDYDWSPSEELPTVVGPVKPIIPAPQPMSGWTVTPYTVLDTDGRSRRPAIKVTVTANLDDVKNVRVKIRLKSTGVVVFDSDATPYGAPYEWVISGQWTLPNTEYEAQGVLVPFTTREMLPSAWLSVTTPNAQMIADDILDGAIISGKIADAAIIASKIMNDAVTSLKLADAAVITSKLAVSAVTSDILALGSVIGSKIADAAVTGAKMAAATIDATKFASGIQPVGIIPGTTVPTTKSLDVITVNGKLYRWNGTAYVVEVASSDIVGQIIGSQIADLAITNPKLAAAAVDAAKLANNAVTNTKIADDAISTPKLQANSVVASVIAAQAVTAKHMILTDTANLVLNGSFQQGLDGWTQLDGTTLPAVATVASGPEARAVALIRPTAGAVNPSMTWGVNYASANAELYGIPVQNGEVIYVEVMVWSNVAGGMNVYGLIGRRKDTGAVIEYGYGGVSIASGVWTKVSSSITITADGYMCPILFNNLPHASTVYMTAFKVMRRNAAKLIVDGTIITNMLAAGVITADKLGANSVIAGKVSAGAINTAELAAGAVITSKLAAASITGDKLAIGTANNLIPNADFSAGLTGWAQYISGGTWAPMSIRTDTFGIPTGSLQVYQDLPAVNEMFADVVCVNPANGLPVKFSVTANKRYELSVYAYGHRSYICQAYIAWVNAAGVEIAYSATPVDTHQNGTPGNDIGVYSRAVVLAYAPVGAVSCKIFFRCWGNTVPFGIQSYTWLAHPYFGEAQINQTEGSTWSSGATTLIADGNVITGSIHANKLIALSITSAQLAAGSITAGKIAAGTIVASDIAASTITGAKIAADTIGATNIAAGAITAKQLVLTDFNNLVPDAQMIDGSAATWTVSPGLWGQYGDPNLFSSRYAWWFYGGPWGSGGYAGGMGSKEFPVKGNAQYRCVATAYSNNNYACLVRIHWLDGNGTIITYVDYLNTGAVAAGGQSANVNVTAPAGAKRASIAFFVQRDNTGGPVYFGGIGVFERNGAELIVDGGIIANHLAANSVTAGAIQANSINAGHLQAGSVTANKMNVTSLSAISATLGNVDISNANIGTLTVGTSNIDPGAVSFAASDSLAGGAWGGGTREVSITVNHGTGSPKVVAWAVGSAVAHPTSSGGMVGTVGVVVAGGGGTSIGGAIPFSAPNNLPAGGMGMTLHTPASGTSSTTYRGRMTGSGAQTANDLVLFVMVFKR